MNLFLSFGSKAARNLTGTVQSIGDQKCVGVRGAEDFGDAFSIVSIRQNDGKIFDMAVFHDEMTADGFGIGAQVSYTMRTLPTEASEHFGVDYALNAQQVIVLRAAVAPVAAIAPVTATPAP